MSKKIYKGDGWSFDPGKEEAAKITNSLPRDTQKIKISLEKRKNKKVVTVIGNLILDTDDMKDLAKSLKTFCGTGGTFRKNLIELQGDFQDKVKQYLKDNGWKLYFSRKIVVGYEIHRPVLCDKISLMRRKFKTL